MAAIVILVLLFLMLWWGVRKHRRIVTCGSCNWRGSWRRWKQTGECPNCGSDLSYWTRRKR